MREKRSLSWWILFLKLSPKGENVHIWRQNAFWGPQPPPEVPCNRKSKHFPLKTLFDGFPFSFAFRLERRHFSTPDTGLRAGRRRKRKPPGALPAGEPREGAADGHAPAYGSRSRHRAAGGLRTPVRSGAPEGPCSRPGYRARWSRNPQYTRGRPPRRDGP